MITEHLKDIPVPYVFQNIELKVEVESLKQELQEKQQLLDKALYVLIQHDVFLMTIILRTRL